LAMANPANPHALMNWSSLFGLARQQANPASSHAFVYCACRPVFTRRCMTCPHFTNTWQMATPPRPLVAFPHHPPVPHPHGSIHRGLARPGAASLQVRLPRLDSTCPKTHRCAYHIGPSAFLWRVYPGYRVCSARSNHHRQ
jgi:hypothetical protein